MERSYQKLALVISINAVVMYINRAYMALMMVAPMVILMLLVMWSMYKRPGLNCAVIGTFAVLFIVSFALARTQTPVGNKQFLRSMIPHHSSAILMCQQSTITDPEIKTLCGQIVKSQEEEIAQMKSIPQRY